MQGYMEHLEGLGLSDATQARALSTVRSLFSFALKVGYVPFNVTQAVELPEGSCHYRVQLLDGSRSAGRSWTHCVPNLRDYTIAALILKTGLRVSECASVNLGDIYEDVPETTACGS